MYGETTKNEKTRSIVSPTLFYTSMKGEEKLVATKHPLRAHTKSNLIDNRDLTVLNDCKPYATGTNVGARLLHAMAQPQPPEMCSEI